MRRAIGHRDRRSFGEDTASVSPPAGPPRRRNIRPARRRASRPSARCRDRSDRPAPARRSRRPRPPAERGDLAGDVEPGHHQPPMRLLAEDMMVVHRRAARIGCAVVPGLDIAGEVARSAGGRGRRDRARGCWSMPIYPGIGLMGEMRDAGWPNIASPRRASWWRYRTRCPSPKLRRSRWPMARRIAC